MMIRRLILMVLFIGSCLWVSIDSQAIEITRLKAVNTTQQTKLIFYAKGRVHFKTLKARNGDLYIDLNQSSPLRFFNPAVYRNTPVANISWKNLSARSIRMIISFAKPVHYKIYAVSGKTNQLILQINQSKKFAVKKIAKKKNIALRKTPKKYATPKKISAPEARIAHEDLVLPAATPTGAPKKIVEMTSTARSKDVIIVIDAGHGGKDPGTTGTRGIREKDVVLRIALQLYQIINQQRGFRAVLTRSGDYYLTLRERLNLARKYKADMFVAIHADAYRDRYASGASLYALSLRGATSEAARWLAARENKSELMGGVHLQDENAVLRSVLINLSQTATIQSSLLIGRQMMIALSQITQLHYHRVEQAAFVVLKNPDIPSLLVETGFLSNPNEERRLNDSYYQYRLAYALMQGIKQYFRAQPPPGTTLAGRRW